MAKDTTTAAIADNSQEPELTAAMFGRVGDLLRKAKDAGRLIKKGKEAAEDVAKLTDEVRKLAHKFNTIAEGGGIGESIAAIRELIRDAVNLVTLRELPNEPKPDPKEVEKARDAILVHLGALEHDELAELASASVLHQKAHPFGIASTEDAKKIEAASIKSRLAIGILRQLLVLIGSTYVGRNNP